MIASTQTTHAPAKTGTSRPSLLFADCVDWLRGKTRQISGRGIIPNTHPERHFSDSFGIPGPQRLRRGRMSRAGRRTYYTFRASREEIAEILRDGQEPRFFRRRRKRLRY